MRKKWWAIVIVLVLVGGCIGGAFATGLLDKITGGGDVVINPNDPADQVKLEKLAKVSNLSYEFKQYTGDSEYVKNNISGSVRFEITNLSEKTIKSISIRKKIYFRGEIIKTEEGTDAARSIASQETSKKSYGFSVRVSDLGDWKIEEFSAEVEITKIDY